MDVEHLRVSLKSLAFRDFYENYTVSDFHLQVMCTNMA